MARHLFAWSAAFALVVAAPAAAQKVVINGVDCTGIVNTRFDGATVSFDAQGNITIEAPGYHVQVLHPGSDAGAPAAGTTTTTTTTTSGGTGTPGGQTVVYSDSGRAMTTGPASYNPPIVEQTTTTVVTTSSGADAHPAGGTATTTGTSPAGGTTASPLTHKYFLITQGTNGAAVGETIQVNINGRQVRQIDSAAAQVIDNISDYLAPGGNAVTMLSTKKTTYVPGAATSTFQVILGEGHVEHGGEVVIDMPLVTYTRTAADATASSRSFTLDAR